MSLLTLKTLDRVKEVIIITGTEQINFLKGRESSLWYRADPITKYKPKTFLQLVKKYDRAGCLVLPISEQDEKPYMFHIPKGCRQIKVYADRGRSSIERIGRFDFMHIPEPGEDAIWMRYDDDLKFTETEMMQFIISRSAAKVKQGMSVEICLYNDMGDMIERIENAPNKKETNSL